MSLAWKLLKTDWRSGELHLLFAALFLAVAVVTGLTLFIERLQVMLVGESSQLLAADRSLKSPRPVGEEWLKKASATALLQAHYLHFQSMIYAGDEPLLASIKAADDPYPLRGSIKYRKEPGGVVLSTQGGPRPGEIWAERRLFALLGLKPGDEVSVGDARLRLTAELVSEPDRGAGMFSMGPRVLMHWDDIGKTGVVQTGSRISYYYLFAGSADAIRQYEKWLLPQLNDSHKWQDLQNTQPTVAVTLQRVKSFFLLASSIIVILASLAIAMASSHFSQRHVRHVAVMKTLGATATTIQNLYLQVLVMLMSIAVLFAWLVAWLLQELVLQQVAQSLQVEIPAVTAWPFILGLFTAMVSLSAFSLPPLIQLRKTPAVEIFRMNTLDAPMFTRQGILIAFAGILVVMVAYTHSLLLGSLLLSGLLLLSLVISLPVAWLLGRIGKVNIRASGWLVLAVSNIKRRLKVNALHVAVFSMSMMLLVILWGVKENLFAEWQAQLPEKTPNYFIMNINESELADIEAWIKKENIATEVLYPMVRARLVEVNNQPLGLHVSQEELKRAGADRELNLSWSDKLPPDNTLADGEWWNKENSRQGVSVEKQLASRLGIKMGDTLTFMSGAESFQARVSSMREIEWDRMRPNFFMLFTQPQLEKFPKSYMTSFWLPPERQHDVTRLLRQFPTVIVIELDGIIGQIRNIIRHASLALELVLFFVMAGSLLVMAATIQGSLGERTRENTVIRALGGTRWLITGSLLAEFASLGLIAGLLATLGAEVVLLVLQHQLLDIEMQLHPRLWWVAPVMGALVVGLAGFLSAYRVLKVTPVQLLRQA